MLQLQYDIPWPGCQCQYHLLYIHLGLLCPLFKVLLANNPSLHSVRQTPISLFTISLESYNSLTYGC